jgi:hypothetical protein
MPSAAPSASVPAAAAPAQDLPSPWAAGEVARAREYGLIPDGMYSAFSEHMTRAEFCRLAMALYEKLAGAAAGGSPAPAFTDTRDAAILNAHALGIVKGVGNGLFMPDSAVTRQEMAVMLYNAIGAIDAAIGRSILGSSGSGSGAYAPTFRDQASIAPWALQASKALRDSEIMIGDDNRRFNPLSNTTKEMAFILVNRVYLVYSGQNAKNTFPPGYTGGIKMLVKGHYLSDGKQAIIGDVHDYYPGIGISDLDDYLSESPHELNGARYYLDMDESLNESVFAGYSFELDSGHYAIYVFVRDGRAGGERIYLATDNGEAYRLYSDFEYGVPLTQAIFSDVAFTVPGSTAVYAYEGPAPAVWDDQWQAGEDDQRQAGEGAYVPAPAASPGALPASGTGGAAAQNAAAGASSAGSAAAGSQSAGAGNAGTGSASPSGSGAASGAGTGAGGAGTAAGAAPELGQPPAEAKPKLALTYSELLASHEYLYDVGLWHIMLKSGEVAQISIYGL